MSEQLALVGDGLIDFQAALGADVADLLENVPNDLVVGCDVVPGDRVREDDDGHASQGAGQVINGPIGRGRAAGGRIGGGAQRDHADDGEHSDDCPKEGMSLEFIALSGQLHVEAVGLYDLLAPAAGADEVGHRDTVDKHHGERRGQAEKKMDAEPAKRLGVFDVV